MLCTICNKAIPEKSKFCVYCGGKIEDPEINLNSGKGFNKTSIIVSFILVIIALFILWSAIEQNKINQREQEKIILKSIEQKDEEDIANREKIKKQKEISMSVVNIMCSVDSIIDEISSGGSGTILSQEGLIITNSHVIPKNKFGSINNTSCFVTLPEAETGSPIEIYVANPIVLPELSDKYDLAFLQVSDVFVDGDGNKFGEYPRVFPSLVDNNSCSQEFVKLGERIRILGYPSSTGGYSLTITEGIVSSFPGDGLIMTSAKIDSGNSGGLAVDENGCMIGIPSSVSVGNYESMGIIISNDLIKEFNNEVQKVN